MPISLPSFFFGNRFFTSCINHTSCHVDEVCLAGPRTRNLEAEQTTSMYMHVSRARARTCLPRSFTAPPISGLSVLTTGVMVCQRRRFGDLFDPWWDWCENLSVFNLPLQLDSN